MTDREDLPPRLASHGSAVEQELLSAASSDAPRRGLRERTISQVLAARRTERRSRWAQRALVAGAAVALAAAVALVVRGRQAQVAPPSPEPVVAAGASASGAPEIPAEPGIVPCTPLAKADGQQPLIDDFEDGDNRVPLLEKRAGSWMTFNDETGHQSPVGANFGAVRIPGGREGSRYALRTRGGKFTEWGAVLALELNPRRCYDASAYSGVEFWAKGRGTIQTALKMTQVVAEEYGGSCKKDCYDNHQHTVTLTREFTRYRVRWAELAQRGTGATVPFDARSLLSLEFSVRPEQTPFDFWIDDVRFIKD